MSHCRGTSINLRGARAIEDRAASQYVALEKLVDQGMEAGLEIASAGASAATLFAFSGGSILGSKHADRTAAKVGAAVAVGGLVIGLIQELLGVRKRAAIKASIFELPGRLLAILDRLDATLDALPPYIKLEKTVESLSTEGRSHALHGAISDETLLAFIHQGVARLRCAALLMALDEFSEDQRKVGTAALRAIDQGMEVGAVVAMPLSSTAPIRAPFRSGRVGTPGVGRSLPGAVPVP